MGDSSYVCVFTVKGFDGIVKVTCDVRSPTCQLQEAITWGGIVDVELRFAKLIPVSKLDIFLSILNRYERVGNPVAGWFKVTVDEIKPLFDLIEGIYWSPEPIASPVSVYPMSNSEVLMGCRSEALCFYNGQKIRIQYNGSMWEGSWNSSGKKIVCGGKDYPSLNTFANAFHKSIKGLSRVSAWNACQCEVDGKWVSTYNLPRRTAS